MSNLDQEKIMEYTTSVNPPAAISFSPSATVWLRLSVIYLIIGVGLGIAMGASENFTLRPVHAHVGLLGWTTLALAGLIYRVYPDAAASRLARIHFWLHNSALPVMMGSLCMLLLGNPEVVPILVASECVAAGGVIVFGCNIFLNVREPSTRSATTRS
jgi:hypothetical protein